MQPKFEMHALKIFALCTAAFAVQKLYAPFTGLFGLDSSSVLQRPWTLITYMFLHANLQHLVSNMFALLLFGLILEKVAGSKNFLKVYFASGIASGLVGVMFYDSIVGASGAIFGAMASLALLRPSLTVWVGYVPMPMVVALFVWAAADFLGVFVPDSVAHIGHLAGMLFGVAYTFAYLRQFMEKPERRYRIRISEETIREWEKRYMLAPKG
ncbi:MAG: rhomboid family intramembrane serine protease [Candidatus Aenigmarchaeota archaeon]|nr:rhomboid family intramembrane serine protease [Candidatus Aenigmarchaeota archaeon]